MSENRQTLTLPLLITRGLIVFPGNQKVIEAGRSFSMKAIQAANKNVIKVALIDNRTIPHEATGKVGRAAVLIKPAKEGTGVIAGGSARDVLELAGVRDIVSKSLGSNTKINVAKATLEALKMQRTPEQVAALRGKKVEEL